MWSLGWSTRVKRIFSDSFDSAGAEYHLIHHLLLEVSISPVWPNVITGMFACLGRVELTTPSFISIISIIVLFMICLVGRTWSNNKGSGGALGWDNGTGALGFGSGLRLGLTGTAQHSSWEKEK